jgi:hypothetical protein
VAGYLHKTFAVVTTLFIPLAVILIKSEGILLKFGIDPNVTSLAIEYIITITPSVYLMGLFDSLRCFLNAQNIFNIQTVIAIIIYGSHAIWCKLFLSFVDRKLIALGLAKCMTSFLLATVLFLAIKFKGLCKETLLPFSRKSAFKGWLIFLKQVVPIGSILYLEMLCFELYTIYAGNLHNTTLLAVHVAAANTSTTYYAVG